MAIVAVASDDEPGLVSQAAIQAFSDPAHRDRHILIDCSKVHYLTSSALGKFLALNHRLRDFGGRVILCGLAPSITEVFAATNLNKVFEIFPTREDALARLRWNTPPSNEDFELGDILNDWEWAMDQLQAGRFRHIQNRYAAVFGHRVVGFGDSARELRDSVSSALGISSSKLVIVYLDTDA